MAKIFSQIADFEPYPNHSVVPEGLADFRLLRAYLFYCTPDWRLAWRRVSNPYVTLLVRGELQVEVESGQVTHVSAGDIVVFPTGIRHKAMPKTTTVDMINVHLTNVNRLTFNWLSSLYFFGVFKATDLEKALLTELCRHHAHRTGEHEVGCRCIDLLTVFWRQLFGCHQLSPELKPLLSLSPRLAEINRILGESLEDSEFCVRQWAEAASVSVAHLRNLVKHHYGVSPTALIQRQRLDRAAQMLRQHSDSVQEIAFDCGFSTVNYFHRVFRKHFGMTPGAWREADETCFQ